MRVLYSFLVGIALAVSPFAASANVSPVRIISTKSNLFYFRVDKSFIGAVVEIYTRDGVLVASQNVTHHKVIIDFYFQNPGWYYIKFKKNDREADFSYEKTDGSPIIVIPNDPPPAMAVHIVQ